MAGDVDDMHRDAMRTFTDEIGELHFGDEFKAGRRAFLKKAAVGGAVLTVGSDLVPIQGVLRGAGAQELTDVELAVCAERRRCDSPRLGRQGARRARVARSARRLGREPRPARRRSG